jgi:hypothetical protein
VKDFASASTTLERPFNSAGREALRKFAGLLMQEYRAYTVGLDGHIISVELMVCAHDAEAIERARRLIKGRSVELWSGARLVILLPAG